MDGHALGVMPSAGHEVYRAVAKRCDHLAIDHAQDRDVRTERVIGPLIDSNCKWDLGARCQAWHRSNPSRRRSLGRLRPMKTRRLWRFSPGFHGR